MEDALNVERVKLKHLWKISFSKIKMTERKNSSMQISALPKSNRTPTSYSPPKLQWKRFSEELPPLKQYGCYLLWNEITGDGTIRIVRAQTNYRTAFPLWATTYSHWAFYKKSKRDHYG